MSVDNKIIQQAAKLILSGKIVIFPTETVYALAGDSSNQQTIDRIYQLKNRPIKQPLSLLLANIEQIDQIVLVDSKVKQLIYYFFPGPLTIILKKRANILISQDTIGIRIPNHPTALNILNIVQKPIIGTSVNLSTHSPAIKVDQINPKIIKGVDLIIDESQTALKISSTVVDLSNGSLKILRLGAISTEKISEVAKNIGIEIED